MRSDTFIGWIPNVAGRLSFSHIGSSHHPSKCMKANRGAADGRRIAVAQRRPLNDWLLPNWYFRYLYGFSSDWIFVFVAETKADKFDGISRLEGEVFIIEREDWVLVRDFHSHTSLQHYFQSEFFSWVDRAADGIVHDSHRTALRQESLFSFDVSLRRSGVMWTKQKYLSASIQFADSYVKSEMRPTDDDTAYVANQVFFFLKDISHKHQHHHSSSDTITELGRLDRRHSWVIQTHYRIHRKIIELRRSNNPKKLYNASGILAYLGALRKAVGFKEGRSRGPLTYNHAEIEQSLKSSLEVMKWKQTQTNIIKTAFPALFVASFGILGYDEGSVGASVRNFLNSALGDSIIKWIIAILMGSAMALFYYGVLSFSELRPVVDAKRILVNLPKRLHGFCWFAGSMLFGVITWNLQFISSNFASLLAAIGVNIDEQIASWFIVCVVLLAAYAGLTSLPVLAALSPLGRKLRAQVRSFQFGRSRAASRLELD